MQLNFIVNELSSSGNAKKVWQNLQNALEKRRVPYRAFVSQHSGHPKKIASDLTKSLSEKAVLAVVGGDGTLNEVINGMQDFENAVVAPIKAGSGNDFCRNVFEKNDVESRLRAILGFDGNSHRMDVGQIEYERRGEPQKRLFAVSSGFGLDAAICKKVNESKLKSALNKIGLGKLAFLLVTLKSVFSMQAFEIKLSSERGEASVKNAVFLAAMNLPSEGGGVYMRPDAMPDDGILSAVSFSFFGMKGVAKNLGKLLKKTHLENSDFSLFGFENAKIVLDKKALFHCDGEFVGSLDRAEYKCFRQMLQYV